MKNCVIVILFALGSTGVHATPRMDQLLECERKLMDTEAYRRLLRVAETYSQTPLDPDAYRILSSSLERYGIKNTLDTNKGEGWGKYGPAIIKFTPDKTQKTKHSLSQNAFRFWMNGQTEFAWAPGWKQGAEGCFFTDYVGSKRILLHTSAFLDALRSPYMITPVVAHEAVHLRNAMNKEKRKPGLFYGKIIHSGIPGYAEYFSLDEVPAWIVTLLELLEKPKNPKDTKQFLSSIQILIRSSSLLESYYKKDYETFKWVRNSEGISVENAKLAEAIRISEIFSLQELGSKEQMKTGLKSALEKRIQFYGKLRSFLKQFSSEDFIKKQFDLTPGQMNQNIPGVTLDYEVLYPLIKNKKDELRQLLRSAF